MSIFTTILTKAGLPIIAIVVGGLLLSRFSSGLVGSATSFGSVLGSVVTAPVTGFVSSVTDTLGSLGSVFGNVGGGVNTAPGTIVSGYGGNVVSGTGGGGGVTGYDDWLAGEDNRTDAELDRWYEDNNVPVPERGGGESTYTPPSVTMPWDEPVSQVSSQASQEGWYYQNFAPGGRDDRQIRLNEGTADSLIERGYDLTFLTGSEIGLSDAGLSLWGRSRGYQ